MTQKHDMTAPKMTRVTVRVPRTTLDQINDWVDTLGVRRSHFLGIALVAGVRSLMQASALEMSLASQVSSSPDTLRPPGQDPALRLPLDGAPADLDKMARTIQTLKAEIAGLQSELADARSEYQTQRMTGKKHS